MIPYFNGHLVDLPIPFYGKVPIHLFGVLVALGVIVGDRIVVMQGRKRGLDANDVKYMNARIVLYGFLVAHLVSVIFYYPERIREDWRVLFNPFAGLSSFGGFLGAFLAFMFFTKRAEIPRLRYADSVALGLSVGWIFGRTGCFTAHDHPGRHVSASFFLSVNYPDGPRVDLGLYELLFTIVMTAILFNYNRKARPPGRMIALAALMYAPARFVLDFFRATDVARPDERYLGLTPAQWACLATAALGLHLWRLAGRPPSDAAPPAPPGTPAEPTAAPPAPSETGGTNDPA
ncbi:MAG TPA: prolipoprotein diacylglyceryl transferase family protein [Polyangia bacterium]|jgi:phosphatidylglycerol:prolipoprotein diacylglycerol transferase